MGIRMDNKTPEYTVSDNWWQVCLTETMMSRAMATWLGLQFQHEFLTWSWYKSQLFTWDCINNSSVALWNQVTNVLIRVKILEITTLEKFDEMMKFKLKMYSTVISSFYISILRMFLVEEIQTCKIQETFSTWKIVVQEDILFQRKQS